MIIHSMKSKQTISTMIALIAVIAVAVPPMVFAVEGEFENSMVNSEKNMKHRMGHMIKDLPELIFSDSSVSSGESLSENLDKEIISITDAIANIKGQVLQIGLKPLQDHLVYHAKVFSNDIITHVIIDAGNGDVLHITDGKTIEEIEAQRAERKEIKTENKLERIDNRIIKIEEKLSQSSGNDELDALREQFVNKLYELREAIENGSSELIQEIKAELQDIRNQLIEMRG